MDDHRRRRPGGLVAGRRATRRALLGALAALGTSPVGCALPWGEAGSPTGTLSPALTTPGGSGRRFEGQRLRLVVSPEGVPLLDDTVRDVIAGAARQVGMGVEVQDTGTFLRGASPGPSGGGDARQAVTHRLLVAVQAGLPPDAVLLLGREAQVARFRDMALVQDVSGLMRQMLRRLGGVPRAGETLHVVAGNWFAVPWYQRLVGHWVRESVVRVAGIDPDGMADYATLHRALSQMAVERGRADSPPAPGGYPPGEVAPWPWGIGGADTLDVDAWCWGAIHAWGGGLVDLKGERVALDSGQTVAALQWLASALAGPSLEGGVPPAALEWPDEAKNAAFLAGETAYTYTERALLSPGTPGGIPDGTGDALGEALYLRTPPGPAARPRAVGGGAAWMLPRGAPAEPAERFLEALLDLGTQRPMWGAGGGFALPAYNAGWDDPGLTGAPWIDQARRFRQELGDGGFVSATGNGGPETAASQAIGALRFGAGMLRAVLEGRPAASVVAETHGRAVDLFRTFGLPGD